MTFLQFKKRFIELYNQQKFLNFKPEVIDFILKADIDAVVAPSLFEALVLAAEDNYAIEFVTKADLQTVLNAILEMEEFKSAFVNNAFFLQDSPASNMTPSNTTLAVSVKQALFNSSPMTDSLNLEVLKGKPSFNGTTINNSPIKVLAASQEVSTKLKFSALADVTFFTNWQSLNLGEEVVKFAAKSPTLYSSVYYTLGEVDLSAKLYDTASMRSATEYFISHYINPDIYLSDVVEETVHDFIYHEL